jgi:hypothetical protein
MFTPEIYNLPGWIPQWVSKQFEYNSISSIDSSSNSISIQSSNLFICTLQFPWGEVAIMPVQWHALALGLFASIIAPFGGFFASGFKRAFKFKVLILFACTCQKDFPFSNSYPDFCAYYSRILATAYLAMVGLQIGWTAKYALLNFIFS